MRAAQTRQVLLRTVISCILGIVFFGDARHVSEAASLYPVTTTDCNLKLDGPIEAGDLERLKSAASRFEETAEIKLCLNSPGGSYLEGLRLIEFILSDLHSLSTTIERDAECLSACALLFLVGHNKNQEMRPARRLHSLGILGFHGPYIKPGHQDYDPQLMMKANRAGYKAVGRLLELNYPLLFPVSLLATTLDKGFDAYVFVDTIAKIGAWDIELTGYRRPKQLTIGMLDQACLNFESWKVWTYDPESDGFQSQPRKMRVPVTFKQRRFRILLPDFGDEAVWFCAADAYDGGPRGLFIKVAMVADASDPSVSDQRGLEKAVTAERPRETTPLWYIFPWSTDLKSTAQ